LYEEVKPTDENANENEDENDNDHENASETNVSEDATTASSNGGDKPNKPRHSYYAHIPHNERELLLTCEHASNAMPYEWKFSEKDAPLASTHWGYDPGSSGVATLLNRRLLSSLVSSRFSRLLCDPNRPIGSQTMFRTEADGQEIELNQNLSKAEKSKRLNKLYFPFHNALKSEFIKLKPDLVLSIHSFTPVYEGVQRKVEVGVLFDSDRDRQLAEKFQSAFASAGIVTELNSPWSGKEGFMFSANQLASVKTPVLMFEFRQDLLKQVEWRNKVVDIMVGVCNELGHASYSPSKEVVKTQLQGRRRPSFTTRELNSDSESIDSADDTSDHKSPKTNRKRKNNKSKKAATETSNESNEKKEDSDKESSTSATSQ